MKKTLLYIALISFVFNGIAQHKPTKIQWHRTYGSGVYARANSVVNSPDGGYVIAGNQKANSPTLWTNNAKVIKIDDSGRVKWEKIFGYDNKDDWAISIINDPQGYVVAGFAGSKIGTDRDVWIVKLDFNGKVLWERTFGEKYHDWANSVIRTSDGGYILAGVTGQRMDGAKWFTASWSDEGDVWIIKLDKNGKMLWEKKYGGKKFDWANCIISTNDGGYLVAGYTESKGEGGEDIWLLKLDEAGEIIWEKLYGNHLHQLASSIIEAIDGGYIVVGVENYEGSAWVYDVTPFRNACDWWIFKIDDNGDMVWDEVYGDEKIDFANSIVITDNKEGYIVVGYSFSVQEDNRDIWIMGLNKRGKKVWDERFGLPGSHDWANKIITTKDKGIAIAGYTKIRKKESNIYLIKMQ